MQMRNVIHQTSMCSPLLWLVHDDDDGGGGGGLEFKPISHP
jgi:hypothetical protein